MYEAFKIGGKKVQETGHRVSQQPCSVCGSSDAKMYAEKTHGCRTWYTSICNSCNHQVTDLDCYKQGITNEPDYVTRKKKRTIMSFDKQPGAAISLKRWNISKETAERFGVTADAKGVYFPYYKGDGQPMGYKQRAYPLENKDTYWVGSESNGSTLFGANVASSKENRNSYLVVCEGEPDAMAGYQLMGNSDYSFVSVPNGAAAFSSALKKNAQFLRGFSRVYYITDNDEAGEAAAVAVSTSMPSLYRVKLPTQYKDVADMLVAGKADAFKAAVYGGKSAVLSAEMEEEEIYEALRRGRGTYWGTGLPKVDAVLSGGLYQNEMSVIMADPGYGKSTMSRWLLNSVSDQGAKPLYLPFEESAPQAVRKLAALMENYDKDDEEGCRNLASRVKERITIIDSSRAPEFKNAQEFCNYISDLIMETGAPFVLIDHVTQIAMMIPGDERLNIQGIMNGLVPVVNQHDSHICVITHNKRTNDETDEDGQPVWRRPTLRDGHGSGSLERTASVVMALSGRDNNTVLSILKDRNGDGIGKDIRLSYIPGGKYSDGSVKQSHNERGQTRQRVGGTGMDTEPRTSEDTTTQQNVSDNSTTGVVVLPGLHTSERSDDRGEGLPSPVGCAENQAFLRHIRHGLYREGSPSILERQFDDWLQNNEVQRVGNEEQATLPHRHEDTGRVEEASDTGQPTESVHRRRTIGLKNTDGKQFVNPFAKTPKQTGERRNLLPVPSRTKDDSANKNVGRRKLL